MKKNDLLEFFLWIFRRNEKDIVNYYNSNSKLLRLLTETDMLNLGFWDEKTNTLYDAQKNMCKIFGKKARLESGQTIVDVGSGLGLPALQWSHEYNPIEITCVDINFNQLKDSMKNFKKQINDEQSEDNNSQENFNFLNGTAKILPFANESVDRVLALESAEHVKPLKNFFSESYRILKKNGTLTMAISVMGKKYAVPRLKLGVLSFGWSAQHYTSEFVESLLKQEGFQIVEQKKIGSNVYEQFADYYIKNRESFKAKILQHYSPYVEKIYFKSVRKMKEVSEKNIIDQLLITCKK